MTNMLRKSALLLAGGATPLLLGLALASSSALLPLETEEIDEFDVFIEINATDGDAGFQGIADADAWNRLRLNDPSGRKLFEMKPAGTLRGHGMAEFLWESDEPGFSELPLSEFLLRFPAGEYTAEGTTVERVRLEGSDVLTHDLPAGPVLTSHVNNQEVELDGNNVVVSWNAVTDDYRGGPLASAIAAYLLIVEYEDEATETVEVLSIDVPAGRTRAAIPGDFLVADREYKIELGAREESGNVTYTEVTILTVDNVP